MAQRAEADGFDGWFVVDSQNLAGDCYVALAQAAAATERIQLGTGVTNPFTRHPAVTASAIASVHAASGGRAVLGIGRGDSALAHLGLAPAPVACSSATSPRCRPTCAARRSAFDELGSRGRRRCRFARPGRPAHLEPAALAATRPAEGAGHGRRDRARR